MTAAPAGGGVYLPRTPSGAGFSRAPPRMVRSAGANEAPLLRSRRGRRSIPSVGLPVAALVMLLAVFPFFSPGAKSAMVVGATGVGSTPSAWQTTAYSPFPSPTGSLPAMRNSSEADSLTGASSGASPSWTRVFPSTQPSPRFGAGMAYDAADGYVVLFGGFAGFYKVGIYEHLRCMNDTWTYSRGVWTNLSLSGPPATCDPHMTFDAADGYVVAYMAQGDGAFWNETWTFLHGKWTQVNTFEPGMAQPSGAAYDASSGQVLMLGLMSGYNGSLMETWEYSDGTWGRLGAPTTPQFSGGGYSPFDLAFDAADGYVVSMAPPETNGSSGAPNGAWAYVNGDWKLMAVLPYSYAGAGALAFDPKDGYLILFGPTLKNSNETLLYSAGSWTNASISGPPGAAAPSMTFDAGDGYAVLFGGAHVTVTGGVGNETLLDQTWIYSTPPVTLHVSMSDAPSVVCSVRSESCGAATDESRVSIGVVASPVTGNDSWGFDSGRGTVAYGPYYWADAPEVSFVGWHNLTPAPNIDPAVSCSLGNGAPPSCALRPSISYLPSGAEELTWIWSGAGTSDSLRLGDSWNISFEVQALGPPYGPVPVDSCTSAVCTAAADGPVDGSFSSLSLSPWGNESRLADSLPLGWVTVLPPLAQNNPPPSPTPPPPPPAVGAPLPVSAPVAPTPVATPAPAVPVVATIGPSLSLSAVAAAIIGAGATRVILARPAQGMRMAIRVAAPSRKRTPNRGTD